MELDVELFVDELLYLLFFPWLAVSEKFEQVSLFVLIELRGRGASRRSLGTASRTWASRTARSNEPQVPAGTGTC